VTSPALSGWAVDSDVATRLTISTFDRFKVDRNLGRAEALRRVMLTYLNDTSSPKCAYPAFRGRFALIGEEACSLSGINCALQMVRSS
jgi:hypothetical protein